ncbi:MAG: septum formation initiator family protein, partial [Pseudomonadota bacterium]
MRWLTLLLVLVIVALQYPLWLGKGSWLRVWEVDQKIAAQQQINQGLKA